jgi:predicted helicase
VYGLLHHPEYRSKYAENLKRELPRIPLVGGVILRSEATKNPGSAENANTGILRSAQNDSAGQSQHDKDVFWAFAKAGKELARLHIEYESLEPWPLKFIETTGVAPGLSPARAARKGGTVAAGTDPRTGVGTPPLQNADLKVGATIPLSYRVEDKMRLAKDHRSLKINDSLTLGGIPPETFEYRLGNRSALEWVIDQYQVTEDKHSGIRSDPNRPDDPEYIVRLIGQVVHVSVKTVNLVKS